MSLLSVTASNDTYIAENATTTNYESGDIYIEGSSTATDKKGLLKFSFTALPSGVVINLATLKLSYYGKNGEPSGNSVLVDRVVRSDWASAQATWNIYKTGSGWTIAGCGHANDRTTTNEGSTTVPASYGWMSVDVTEMVKDVQSVEAIDMVVVANWATPGVRAYFYDNRHATLKPTLEITYALPVKSVLVF